MNCRACNEPCGDSLFCDNLCRYHKLPFRAWDGEGYNETKSSRHNFNVLATNGEVLCLEPTLQNRDGEYIHTLDAFKFLTKTREPAINVWFFFDYDVNCILRDIPLYPFLDELARTNQTKWRGWKIKYVPNKIFSVKRGSYKFTSYDTFGFFQKSFINACKDFGLDVANIERGKSERANFANWKIEDVIEYNNEELRLLVELMTILRKYLGFKAPGKSWYGPGAVSAQWLMREVHLKPIKHRNTIPEMQEAIMHSYFGGRIDVRQIGEMDLHCIDITSAYPAAMTTIYEIESWDHKTFSNTENITKFEPMGLYRCNWSLPRFIPWGPFPWRSNKGQILYPSRGEGWYYGIEVTAAKLLFPDIHTTEAWIPTPKMRNNKSQFPLRNAIVRAFTERQRLISERNPSELAYKLILNSMYGKFAQKRTSYREPRYQNYIWAGYTTAYTRAMLLDIIRISPNDVIACATDSIFTRSLLCKANTESILGEWKDEGYTPTLFVMPGVYARFVEGLVKKYRQRGFPVPINYGTILRSWGCETKLDTDGTENDYVSLHKFVTFRHAIAQNRKEWGYFDEEKRGFQNVALLGFSKRYPNPLELLNNPWKTKSMLTVSAPEAELYSHIYSVPTFEEEVERDELELLNAG